MDDDAPGSRDRGDDRIITWPFVNLFLANLVLRTAMLMLVVLAPLYVLDLGGSAVLAGLTVTAFMVTAIVFRPIGGSLVDTRGRTIIMLIGAAIVVVGTAVLTVPAPIWLFLAARAIQGIGFSLGGTATTTMATDLIPERRMAQGLGYLGLEAVVAPVIGPLLAIAIADTAGYTTAFAVALGLTVVNLLLRLPLHRRFRAVDRARADAARAAAAESAGAADARPARGLGAVLGRIVEGSAWRPAVVLFFVMFSMAATNTFLAAYADERGIPGVALFFTAMGVAVLLSRLLMGPLQRLVGDGWLLGSGIVLIAAAMPVVVVAPGLGALVAAGVAFGWGMGVVQPGFNSLAVLTARPERRGRATSTIFMAVDLSQALGGIVLGLVATRLGLGSVFAVTAVLVVVGLVVFVTGGRGPHRTVR